MTASVPLDIVPFWARPNDQLITLVDVIPDDKLNWSPKPELWNFRGILLHIAGARDYWMGRIVRDGDRAPSAQRLRDRALEERDQA